MPLHPALAVPVCHQCKIAWYNTDLTSVNKEGKEVLCRYVLWFHDLVYVVHLFVDGVGSKEAGRW